MKDVTVTIMASADLPERIKTEWQLQSRRFFVFAYPSDGMRLKSIVSFAEEASDESLIVLLRGASRMEAVPSFLQPTYETQFAAASRATIVLGVYRDGPNTGVDAFGGADVSDVMHLTEHLPQLMHKLHLSVDFDKSYLVGVSRGSMQMFLALATHPHLQEFYKKFVSLSGILNIELFAKNNPEWVQKMKDHFEYDGSKAWLDTRNPILQVSKIANKNLPFLLIQGTDDPKVCLEEGYSMLNAMLQSGFTNVSYCEVAGGNHVLKNRTEYFQRIIFWLETRAFR